MKISSRLAFTTFSAVVFNFCLYAQETRQITGKIIDATNNDPLPFVSIGLKKQLIGNVSNEVGNFDLIIPNTTNEDTLVVIGFGYHRLQLPVKNIHESLTIRLQPSPVLLQEVEVIPLSPELYIRMAMRKIAKNYPSQAFESIAYYREKMLENKEFIQMDEGVFKIYCPNYSDTAKNQNQLLLYRKAENTKSIAFMSKERAKEEEKKKKGEKPKENNVDIDMASSFSGPESILSSAKISAENSAFLDTTKLKEFKYNFAKSGTGEFLVIEFKSRGKVDHLKESGKIYIETGSFAIAKIESTGDFIIPAIVKPILFFYRLGIDNPTFKKNIEFQQIEGKWYPRYIHSTVDLKLIRRHWFSRNERSAFEVEQNYVVNRFNVKNPSAIPREKQFDSSKKMEEQTLFNDEQLKWEHINIIKQ